MPRLLLKSNGVLVEQFCPLDPEPPYQPPDTWDGPHVQHRFGDALETLRKLPMGRLRPAGMRGSWPLFPLDYDAFMGRMSADIEGMAVEGKLDQEFVAAYQGWTADRNRHRDPPSARQISCMEHALLWPGHYLRDRDELARALNLCGLARASGLSVQQVVRGGKHKGARSPTQWNQLALEAADQVAAGLRINKIAVF